MQELYTDLANFLCLKCRVDALKQQNLAIIISPTCVQNKIRNSV